MGNYVKTDYMDSPNLGYSEYFLKSKNDLSAISPKQGDRAMVADEGKVYICVTQGSWERFGNTGSSGSITIAATINSNSTNDDAAGAYAVYEYVEGTRTPIATEINASSTNSEAAGAQATYEYGQTLKTPIATTINSNSTNSEAAGAKAVYDAIQAGGGGSVQIATTINSESTNNKAAGAKAVYDYARGNYLPTAGGTMTGNIISKGNYANEYRITFNLSDTTIYNSAALTRVSGIIAGTITPTVSDFEYYDLNLTGRIETQDYELLNRAINGDNGVTWNEAYTIRRMVYGADTTRTYTGNQPYYARAIGTYGAIRWKYTGETSYTDDDNHKLAFAYKDVLSLTNIHPDWEDSDVDDPAYIKNRPFYEDTITTPNITFATANWQSFGENQYIQATEGTLLGLEIGKTYYLQYVENNTTVTKSTQCQIDSEFGVPSIYFYTEDFTSGVLDGLVIEGGTPTTGTGYGVTLLISDLSSAPDLTLLGWEKTDLKQIDAKFIPVPTYTTTDKIVAKWIDGKDIYERVVSTTLSSFIAEKDVAVTGASIDQIINIKGMIKDNGGLQAPLGGNIFADGAIIYSSSAVYMGGDTITLELFDDGTLTYPATANIIIQYTKSFS